LRDFSDELRVVIAMEYQEVMMKVLLMVAMLGLSLQISQWHMFKALISKLIVSIESMSVVGEDRC